MPESNDTSSTSSSSSLTPTTQTNGTNSTVQQQQQVTEKPSHYTYLKGFRVEQCALFLQHKCTQHRPYTCFYWHFKNQRRRRPMRKRDGMFNYNPDVYCEKYDEQTGVCPNGDECALVHRNAGDTEKRYHLRYYKTATCIHETDAKGNCSKNGSHCAFAHGPNDLRPPVYDLKEMQLLQEKQEDSEFNSTNDKITNLQSNIDKDKQLNEDPKWNDTNYVLINYKTEQCKRPPRLCRQGFACPQYHNSRDKRRNPSIFKYRSTPCPNVKQGDDWLEPSVCENGDLCKYCHSRTEQQFHPEIYKSSKCNDMISTGYCPRGPFCAFAHVEHELKTQRAHSTSESSNSDYTLENFITNILPSVDKAASTHSDMADVKEENKIYNKAIGCERKQNIDDTVSSPSSSSSSSSSPMQQQKQQQDAPPAQQPQPPTTTQQQTSTTSPKNIELLQQQQQQQQTSLNNLNNLNSINSIAALTTAFTNNLVIDYEKEKLRQDLIKQTELSNKLELLCCQYRQVSQHFSFIATPL